MNFYRHRRAFQILFLAAFLVLLTLTYRPLADFYHSIFLLSDPLVALLSLRGGFLGLKLIGALLVLLSALALGRVFCGYVCPLGFIVELTSPSAGKYAANEVNVFPQLPLLVLAALLIVSFLGSSLLFTMDPLVLLTRSVTTLVYPVLDRATRVSGDVLYHIKSLRPWVDAATNVSSGIFIFEHPLRYQLQILILALFASVILLSLAQSRFWCRYLCPLGAFLGLVGRISLFGRTVSPDKCIVCDKCARACHLGAVREKGLATDKSLCQSCLRCAEVCPVDAVGYGRTLATVSYSPSRRAFLGTAVLASAYGFFVSNSVARAAPQPRLLRPPGANKEKDFLGICARCGECAKVCPTNTIQPALVGAGWEGLFTPELDFNNGYCDWSCNWCGKVCPTGAISRLTLEKKRTMVIGIARIDKNNCLPWNYFKNCIVCQELCPVPDKAVILKEEAVVTPQGKHLVLKRPFVVTERCIGCGVCQHRCPAPSQAAIVVYSLKQAEL